MLSLQIPVTPIPDNTGKVFTKRTFPKGRTTVSLTYEPNDADNMRALVETIRLKGGRVPSMTLMARRAMQRYFDDLARVRFSRPDIWDLEVAELNRMVTPSPKTPVKSRKAG